MKSLSLAVASQYSIESSSQRTIANHAMPHTSNAIRAGEYFENGMGAWSMFRYFMRSRGQPDHQRGGYITNRCLRRHHQPASAADGVQARLRGMEMDHRSGSICTPRAATEGTRNGPTSPAPRSARTRGGRGVARTGVGTSGAATGESGASWNRINLQQVCGRAQEGEMASTDGL